MSDGWDDRSMKLGRSDGGPERSDDRGLLLAILAVCGIGALLVLTCAGVLVWRFVRPVDLPPADVETAESRRADLRDAFTAADVGISPAELTRLSALFDQVADAGRREDNAAFVRLVDLDRLYVEMKRSGEMPAQMRFLDDMTRKMLHFQIGLPWYVARHKIVHVRLSPGGTDAVVYGYFWDEDDEAAEMRWWVAREQGQWKIYDWELLQFGMRESRELALLESGGSDVYYEFHGELEQASSEFAGGDAGGTARRRMQRAESLLPKLPPALRDQALLSIAYYWSYHGHLREAADAAERISDPDAVPGAHFCRMVYHDSRGESEQVLADCDRYEAAIGPGPNTAHYRAEALTSLERDEPAAAAWKQVLKYQPHDTHALREYARLLPEGSKPQLVEVVAGSADPLTTAVDLAVTCSMNDDPAAVDVLAKFVAAREPASDRAAFLAGLSHELEFDDEAAAESFLTAATAGTDAPRRLQYVGRYLDVMSRLGRVTAAYRLAPDPAAAFDYLANGEDGEGASLPAEVLSELVAEHRRRVPDDPWGHYHRAALLLAEADSEGALRELEQGLAKIDEEKIDEDSDESSDLRWSLEERLHQCLLGSGRWRDAYEHGREPLQTFARLAAILDRAADVDTLEQLVTLHRQKHPADPELNYYSGAVAMARGDFDKAARLLQLGRTMLGDTPPQQYHQHRFRHREVVARLRAGDAQSAYARIEPPDQDASFGVLAHELSTRRQWDELAALAAEHRERKPDSWPARYWAAAAHWQRSNYPQVIAAVGSLPEGEGDELNHFEPDRAVELAVRSHVRLGQTAAALALGRAHHDRHGEALPLILASVAAGDASESGRLLKEEPEYQLSVLFADPDIGERLRGAEYASFRAEYPPPLPSLHLQRLTGLCSRPMLLLPEEVAVLAAEVFGDGTRVTRLPPVGGEHAATTDLIESRDERFFVTLGSGPCFGAGGSLEYSPADRSVTKVLRGHSGWFSVGVVRPGWSVHDDPIDDPLRALARRLADETLLAVYHERQGRLVAAGSDLDRLLGDSTSDSDWDDHGANVYLSLLREVDDREQWIEDRLRRRLRLLAQALAARRPDQEFEVAAMLGLPGAAAEQVRVAPARVSRSNYGAREITGTLIDASRLAPWLKAGDNVRLNSWQVVDWRYADGDTSHHARSEAEEWWRRTREETRPTPHASP
jgi:hypothetical protein